MIVRSRLVIVVAALVLACSAAVMAADAPAPPAGIESKKPGDTVPVGPLAVTVKEVRTLPVVRNKFSERFVWDKYDNPRLRKLREQEKLDEVVADGKTEFDRQVLLLDWTYRRFKKFGTPTSDPQGALEILKDVDAGGTFYCAYYANVLVSAAASLGWVDRPLSLRLGTKVHGDPTEGSTEHTITEIWSNQFAKWIMFDPTYAVYVERDGVPLSAWEIRQEWFYGDPARLDFVVGAARKKYKAKDMPIFRARHPGYGDLALGPRTIDKYAFLGYVPNTNLMDAGPDWARMFITKDALCDGVTWHRRDNPQDPAREPYFPLDQAALTLTPADGGAARLAVKVETMTPNLAGFRWRQDGGKWTEGSPADWTLHPGSNVLEVLAVNQFGIEGPPSKIILEAK